MKSFTKMELYFECPNCNEEVRFFIELNASTKKGWEYDIEGVCPECAAPITYSWFITSDNVYLTDEERE